MSVSEYRRKILERVEKHRSEVDREVNSILDLADSKEKLTELLGIINDSSATAVQRTDALSMFNAVSNFSPASRVLQSEIVNILRGQIEASDPSLRLGAISTLAALKDDIVQERLLEEITSDKPEEDRLVPTASAISMLGRDEKTLPPSVLQKIMMNPPTKESQIEAIRQMPSDPNACEALLSLMKDDKVPLAARTMIPEMVGDASPDAFLSAAVDMLNASGADHELAPWLVKGIANVSSAQAPEAVVSARTVVAELRDSAPASFEAAAQILLDTEGAAKG